MSPLHLIRTKLACEDRLIPASFAAKPKQSKSLLVMKRRHDNRSGYPSHQYTIGQADLLGLSKVLLAEAESELSSLDKLIKPLQLERDILAHISNAASLRPRRTIAELEGKVREVERHISDSKLALSKLEETTTLKTVLNESGMEEETVVGTGHIEEVLDTSQPLDIPLSTHNTRHYYNPSTLLSLTTTLLLHQATHPEAHTDPRIHKVHCSLKKIIELNRKVLLSLDFDNSVRKMWEGVPKLPISSDFWVATLGPRSPVVVWDGHFHDLRERMDFTFRREAGWRYERAVKELRMLEKEVERELGRLVLSRCERGFKKLTGFLRDGHYTGTERKA
ncbi:hypothetical protein BJ508DRAFT_349499 [Ascobolus immersus RN42]|uniref:Uncharacterized protein n=1 Tax=Ascobolus immersus RN42 TaxID=1160509 RepID=A0A3N4HX79_ASCIM|nr:hypothetical protein BJ508DRAFT_349499 [Ascobolus immersus RN42]